MGISLMLLILLIIALGLKIWVSLRIEKEMRKEPLWRNVMHLIELGDWLYLAIRVLVALLVGALLLGL